jgi:hypothetical protein
VSFNKSSTPNLCPLCGENNACGNLSANKSAKDCWCVDSSITFADSLLSQVSDADKNKSCICKACAVSHQSNIETLVINAGTRSKNSK